MPEYAAADMDKLSQDIRAELSSNSTVVESQQIMAKLDTTIKLLGLLHETLQALLETTNEGLRIQVNGEKLTKAVLEEYNQKEI